VATVLKYFYFGELNIFLIKLFDSARAERF